MSPSSKRTSEFNKRTKNRQTQNRSSLGGIVSTGGPVTWVGSENPATQSNVGPLDLVNGVKVSRPPHLLNGLCDQHVSPGAMERRE